MQDATQAAEIPAASRPHFPFVVVTSDGYWGRGQTEAEARAEAKKAGARFSRKGVKVKVISCPENIRDGEIDSYGAFCYFEVDENGPTYTSNGWQ